MVEIKTAAEIQGMRAAGQVVAQILAVDDQGKAGMRLTELNQIARDVLAGPAPSRRSSVSAGFAPAPFRAPIRTSVNDAAPHGIPGVRLADGDLLSVDSGATLDGWTGDAAISFTIGPPGPADARLIATTSGRSAPGIAAAVPGGGSGTFGGYRRRRARGGRRNPHHFGGHGVGRAMTRIPRSPTKDREARPRLVLGLVIRSSRGSWLWQGRLSDRRRRLDDPQRHGAGPLRRARGAVTEDGPQSGRRPNPSTPRQLPHLRPPRG